MGRNVKRTRHDGGRLVVALLVRYHSGSLPSRLGSYLFTVPEVVPVPQPNITRADCEGLFVHRLGAAVIFSVQAFLYFLSPSGDFVALSKIFLRWFIFLASITLSVGVPTLIAAQFIASISSLAYLAAQNFFYAVAFFVGACALLAVGMTLILSFFRK